jgi:nitrogen PTS system EIIA component
LTATPKSLADLIGQDHVLADLRCRDKGQLLSDLARAAAAVVSVPDATIAAALAAREALGPTGFGNGFALPHARLDGLDQPFGLFARLARPIDFGAIDQKPVDLVFLLLLPAGADQANVSTLAAVARELRSPAKLEQLRRARGAQLRQALISQ